MLISIVDTETSGLDPNTCVAVEFAAAQFDTESNSVLGVCSVLISTDTIPAEVTKIHGITSDMTRYIGSCKREDYHELVRSVTIGSECIIAHNAKFDKQFVPAQALPWVCSYEDLEWPGVKPTKLTYMCCDLGIPVTGAHRAINDVLMLCEMLKKLPNLEEQIETILTVPPRVFAADVSFQQNNLAKDAGFSWESGIKKWVKKIRKSNENLVKWKVSLPFRVLEVKK
jgi:DNA polymerase III epsilon subunit-like protein